MLKEHDTAAKTAEICRTHGIHPARFQNVKGRDGDLEVSDVMRTKQVEE